MFIDKEPLLAHILRTKKNKYPQKSDVNQIIMYDFRHSCASLLVNKESNVQFVEKYLGHTKVEETLKTYSHLFTSILD